MTRPISRLGARNVERTRAALIDAAADMCLDRGYENTTVEQIAAAAGVSPRTCGRQFPGRNAVFVAVLDELDEAVASQLAAVPAHLGPVAAVRSAFGLVFARAHRLPYHGLTAARIVRKVRVVTACEALRHAARGYRGPQLRAAAARRMNLDVEDPRVALCMALIGETMLHAFTIVAASGVELDPAVIGAHVDESFGQIATLTADLTGPLGE